MKGHSAIINKKIEAVVEIGPNYIFHLMAVARVGFNSEYADIYHESVKSLDITYLQSQKEQLSFLFGHGGDLVGLIINLPAYFCLNNQTAFSQYFKILEDGYTQRNFGRWFEYYEKNLKDLIIWFGVDDFNAYLTDWLIQIYSGYREIISKIAEIIDRNFENYIKQVWPIEIEKLNATALQINEYFGEKNIISEWEFLTGRIFKSDHYQIVLSSAIKNGPNANSLGYDRVVFHHDRPFEYTTQLISHEIGTHILIDIFNEIKKLDIYEYDLLYATYECLAKFYNCKILEIEITAYDIKHQNASRIRNIFHSIYNRAPSISPHELLICGLDTFLKE
jgi:hypothetical protein